MTYEDMPVRFSIQRTTTPRRDENPSLNARLAVWCVINLVQPHRGMCGLRSEFARRHRHVQWHHQHHFAVGGGRSAAWQNEDPSHLRLEALHGLGLGMMGSRSLSLSLSPDGSAVRGDSATSSGCSTIQLMAASALWLNVLDSALPASLRSNP
jgi:hypothetical protein